ncbi:tetratricopeptide repeat protein [Novosphingobium sp. B 225]|uniref:tetratricopeptide repeat protein n=1 Tax=Novosphingobium sp. B 225 TaxID=1961849 RepID=UPI001124CCD4|nr:tetratricopeptide repeat protein [Novosphingobium sp. B 225]
MRYTPAALALALLAGVTSSIGQGATPTPLDPRAAALIQQGRAALGAGNIDGAIDAYESALAVQPGHVAIYLNLAEATRKQGMQGKALHYYRQALMIDPGNQYAIAGEGEALVEKGAVEKARRNLARLRQLCGGDCPPSLTLAAAIQKGPAPRVVTADQVKPQPVVSQN